MIGINFGTALREVEKALGLRPELQQARKSRSRTSVRRRRDRVPFDELRAGGMTEKRRRAAALQVPALAVLTGL